MTAPVTDLNPPDLFHARIQIMGDPAVISWSLVEWSEPAQCTCQDPDGGTGIICVLCAESCSWDYHIWWPEPVRVTANMTRLIRARREAMGYSWAQLAGKAGVPVGTMSSLGYAPQHLPALVFRTVAHALKLTTQQLLDGLGG